MNNVHTIFIYIILLYYIYNIFITLLLFYYLSTPFIEHRPISPTQTQVKYIERKYPSIADA